MTKARLSTRLLKFCFSLAIVVIAAEQSHVIARASIASPPLGIKSAMSMKKETLDQLKLLQQSNLRTLQTINNSLDTKLKNTRRVQIDSKSDLTILAALPNSLKEIKEQQQEYVLRRDFLDRLIFQLDSKWNGTDLKSFLEVTLLDMASIDLTDESGRANDAAFLTYLSMAVRELTERNENLVSFVEGYMNFSTLSSPKSPQKYLLARSYLNGAKTYSAREVKKEDVGDLVADKLQRPIGKLKYKAAKNSRPLPPSQLAPQFDFQPDTTRPTLTEKPVEAAGNTTIQ